MTTHGVAARTISEPGMPAAISCVVLVDRYPELTETFVANEAGALARGGHAVRIEAAMRGGAGYAPPGVEIRYREDDPRAQRQKDLLWLVSRHPLRCLEDLCARLRWRGDEWVRPLRQLAPVARRAVRGGATHVHCHFAAGAALDALRISRLLGLPLSVTAHAYDIFLAPRNLREKLESADVVSTGCDYNVRYLQGLVGPEYAGHIHKIVMGVDAERFHRTRPLPGGRTVVAVGRLVPKKGFDDLIRAAAILASRCEVERVVIVGDGSERERLAALAAEAGGIVELSGARTPDDVRTILEEADVLAMPSVVATDGDRDSMPVVVKEAMAMELMVVGTDEVGLPEVVRPPWGRLVPPRDPEALAAALSEALALGPAERSAAGAAGRAWVMEHANVDREAERLAALLHLAAG
jgi:glycosyltransferase involved in cell wall biosynthesis